MFKRVQTTLLMEMVFYVAGWQVKGARGPMISLSNPMFTRASLSIEFEMDFFLDKQQGNVSMLENTDKCEPQLQM